MIVTSHLLGELERVCGSIVVIDGGQLLRHSSTASVTAQTAAVVLEIEGDQATSSARFTESGVAVRVAGRLLYVDVSDDTVHDIVRDTWPISAWGSFAWNVSDTG